MNDPATLVSTCLQCERPLIETNLAVCSRCLDRGQRLVSDVVADIDRFPYTHMELVGLRSPRFDVTGTAPADDEARLPFGMDSYVEDPAAVLVSAARTPTSALDILDSWARAWADQRGDDAPSSTEEYLLDHTLWAMQNPEASGWSLYAQEARAVRSTVRRLLGIDPVREGASCPDCGGRTVREWRPRADRTPSHDGEPVRHRLGTDAEGLDDVVRCVRCQRSWPHAARLHAEVLASIQPSALRARRPWVVMTFAQLVLALDGRARRATIATWIHRGWLPPVAGPETRAVSRSRRWRDGSVERVYRVVDAELLADWLAAETEDRARTARLAAEDVASTG